MTKKSITLFMLFLLSYSLSNGNGLLFERTINYDYKSEKSSTMAPDTIKEWDTQIKVDRETSTIGLTAQQTHSSEEIRKDWLKKGGKVNYNDFKVTGLFMGTSYASIVGFGGSYSRNTYDLVIPEYKPGKTTWSNIHYGGGLDFQVLTGSGVSFTSFSINGNFGWIKGFGRFLSEDNWKGVALIATYRPSFNISSYGSDFNYLGFNITLKFTDFYARMEKLAPKPTKKVSLFIIPPIGNLPLFVSVGFGLQFYGK